MDYYDLAFPKNASAADAINNNAAPPATNVNSGINNPYTTPEDRAKFDSLSPADQAWLTKGGGKPDINDPFILARSPNKGKPAPAAGNGLSPEEQAQLDQAQNSSSEPVIDPATTDKKEPVEPGTKKTSAALGVASGDTSTSATADVPQGPLMNPLHSYPSYTYNLSLHLMTDADYIEMIETEQYVAKRVLIASAGRYNNSSGSDQFTRAPRFQEDFYFDSLTLETVSQPTEQNRNTNALTCDFTLIEPYGFTLIERLLRTSQDIGSKNYLDMPYMLQIDFFAMNDAGEVTGLLSNLTKRIPLKLLSMETTVSTRGSEYHIKAAVYGHMSFSEVYGSSPASFEMTGNKVGSFFQGGLLDDSQYRLLQRQASDQFGGEKKNTANNGSISGGRPPGADENPKIASYAAAINGWQQALKEAKKVQYPDIYRFEFDPEIADKFFVLQNLVNHQDTAFTPRDDAKSVSDSYLSNAGQARDQLDQTRQTFAINAGTTVDRVIDYIVRNSTYILDQLVIPEDYKDGEKYRAAIKSNNGPLKWWKIVPRVKFRDYDTIRNVYSKEITYYVKKYLIKYLPLDFAPRSAEQLAIKKYDYIYTGQNIDVIDFDLKFNMTYHTASTAYRDSVEEVSPVPDASEGDKSDNVADYQGSDASWESNVALDGNSVAPLQQYPRVADTRARATGSVVTSKQVAAADVEGYILSKMQGDMIGVKLKIIGDPHYIKQDDIFYRPVFASDTTVAVDPGIDPRLTPNGSIRTDDGTVYVNLTFRTPMDINDPDGLMKFSDQNLTQSAFSGLYRLITVTSHFQGGQFTQELDLVRAPRQAEDAVNSAKVSSDQRSESTVNQTKSMDNVQGSGPAKPASTDVDEGTKPNQNASESQTPGPDIPPAADQKDLAEVNATAEEKPITQQTEPVATPPPNESTQAAAARLIYQRGKLADQQISINNELSNLRFRESGVVDRPLTAADRQRLQQLQAQYNALNTQIDAIDAQIKNLRGQ
jgi:hypothetical protein